MKRNTIYFKSFLATAALVIVSFLMLGVAFFILGRSFIINDYRNRMDANADEVVHTASAMYQTDGLNNWELRFVISSMAASSGNHIFITNSDGTVILCSDKELVCEHIGKEISPMTLALIDRAGDMDQITTLDGFYPGTRFVVGKPILSDDTTIGYVFLSSNTTSIMGAYRAFIGVMLAVMAAVILFALLLSLFFSKKLSEPLEDMVTATRRFSHGDFSTRIDYQGNQSDEITVLVDSFNEMAESLEKTEIRRQEFISNISHELRTPMTTITGFAEGILDGTIPQEEQNKYLSSIVYETRRLTRLVRNMLDTSQVQAKVTDKTRRKDFDLTELILQNLLSFEMRMEERHLDINLQLPEDHIFVHADPDAITQVIYNLVDNAIKFSFENTVLAVLLYKKEDKAYVSIKDRGETIPPDDLPYIFDRFHKSDRSRSLDKDGVGLGLYLVKTIIEGHDEDIAVTSRDGVTEFVFTLPLAEAQ